MATYDLKSVGRLSAKLKKKAPIATKVAADVINRTSTFAIREAINDITKTVNLKPSYLRRKIKTVGRASQSNLRAIIGTSNRHVLLKNFRHVQTKDGFKVAVNAKAGFKDIRHARLMRLKGSGKLAIALTNERAYEAALDALSDGQGSKPAKLNRLARLQRDSKTMPRALTPLASRSPTQLFKTSRETIQPQVKRHMRREFLKDFRRLSQ